MIRIDDRKGSGELARYFTPYGIRTQVERMDFGDFAWEGSGPRGSCMVGVERKRIEDLIDSMQSKRLSGHQLPGIAAHYDFAYLLVEGMWRPNSEGLVEICNGGGWKARGLHYRALDGYLSSIELRGGLYLRRTATMAESVWQLASLYLGWQKDWAEHRAHDVVYAPAEPRRQLFSRARHVSLCEKAVMQIPGVGDKAQFIADRFKSWRAAAKAPIEAWIGLEWRTRKGLLRHISAEEAGRIDALIGGSE